MSESPATVYTGAKVLVGDPRLRRVEQVELRVADGVITEIGPELDRTGAEVVDVSWAWIMPGLVDTHHHIWQATMGALTSDFTLDDYFWTIRRNHSTVHRADDVYNGTFGGAVAMLDAGTTSTVDFSHCILSPDHADAGITGFIDSGIRGVWCYGFYHQPMEAPHFHSPEERYDDARRIKSTYFSAESGRVRFGVSPTESARVPFEQIIDEVRMGRELNGLVHPHTNTRARIGHPSDIQGWHAAGLIWSHQLHSHCNSIDAADLKILADAGAAVSSTPETELGMGLGPMVVTASDRAGVTTGLGADIQANNSPDLFTQMRIALGAERYRYQQPIVEERGTSGLERVTLRTEDVLHFATLGGARGLGLGDVTGSIEVGKAADLLFINTDTPRLRAVTDVVNSIVMHVTVADIDTVMVGGDVVKKGGRLRDDLRTRAVVALDESGAYLAKAVQAHGGWTPDKPEWMGTPAEHHLSNAGV
ncbi:amidohydrolase family protein [Nocardioides mangrovi]|uniref:Amidohydrolase family protein n=1 Tax=Nocardioides mangrovi TaxID=2874580 RepID=A0ABS7UEY2_9ACTN|nr:amidohydrolase family protein [Nocardioides mangrovi]MBZ5739564.1 amidohydrolase family protein [Nocardioides mangrovi]